LIHGDSETALQDPNSIILTEEESRKFFGNENPMGIFINIHIVYGGRVEDWNLKVTGVARAMPGNSHFEFEYLIPQVKNPYIDPDIEKRVNLCLKIYTKLFPSRAKIPLNKEEGQELRKYILNGI